MLGDCPIVYKLNLTIVEHGDGDLCGGVVGARLGQLKVRPAPRPVLRVVHQDVARQLKMVRNMIQTARVPLRENGKSCPMYHFKVAAKSFVTQ